MNPKYILSALLLFLFARMLAADSSEIGFPIEIAGLINYGCHDYQEPGLGYSIRYQNNTLVKVDIYVYDKNLKGIGNRSVSDLVQKEFSEVIQYYGSQLRRTLDPLNYALVRWATRKYKKLDKTTEEGS